MGAAARLRRSGRFETSRGTGCSEGEPRDAAGYSLPADLNGSEALRRVAIAFTRARAPRVRARDAPRLRPRGAHGRGGRCRRLVARHSRVPVPAARLASWWQLPRAVARRSRAAPFAVGGSTLAAALAPAFAALGLLHAVLFWLIAVWRNKALTTAPA
jgi:hypothetical protein